MRKLTQAGDTIVEVLIAIAVISSVLGLTYGAMNRNLRILRDNQERTEATKLAQAQIENLKAAWDNNTTKAQVVSQGDNGFCMTGTALTDLPGSGAAGSPTIDPAADNFANYVASCKTAGTGDFYNVGIKRLTGQTYRVFVRYDKLGDDGRSEIVLVYTLP